MEFFKISATGNDFILIDNRKGELLGKEHEFFRRICKRRLGVGADGILLINKSEKHDFSLLYFNSDGHIGEMCGNGARAAAFFAYKMKFAPPEVSFDVLGVKYQAQITAGGVKLFTPPPVEIKLKPGFVEEDFLQEGGYLNVGVPHYVLFVQDVASINVVELGRKYRYHQKFQPWGTNTNFVEIYNKRKLKIRTYERGVEEETLACGTGAISAAIIAYQQKGIKTPIGVESKGGMLEVDFDNNLNYITLTGQVRIVYKGELINS